jgi:hypothetical protein
MPDTEISVHRFPQRLAFRAPAGLPQAIEAAARQRHTNPSEWTRQAVLRALEADGVRLSTDSRVSRPSPVQSARATGLRGHQSRRGRDRGAGGRLQK